MQTIPAIQRLQDEFERLPGIGPKSAQRLVYWVLNNDRASAQHLSDAIIQAKDKVHFCRQCFNYAEGDLCPICASPKRDHSIICVVSEPRDIPPIESTGTFNGLYHVLHGALSPLDDIGPQKLHINELMKRLKDGNVKEVILATNPNVEGETTASYLAHLIRPLGIKVTRPASGLPVGGDLEFADEVTLSRALESRREF